MAIYANSLERRFRGAPKELQTRVWLEKSSLLYLGRGRRVSYSRFYGCIWSSRGCLFDDFTVFIPELDPMNTIANTILN